MNTPELLSAWETCPRKGYYSRSVEPQRMKSSQMTLLAIQEALCGSGGDPGEMAGSAVMQYAEDRGLDTRSHKIYDSILHHAALADLLVTCIRKSGESPWLPAPGVQNWTSGAFISPDGLSLRRVVLVSHWSDERRDSECRSWYTLGEQAHYNLPMQMVVCVIGQERDGRRSTPFTTGFLHPKNHQLRFRKRSKGTRQDGNVFNDSWERIHREEHAEISRETWLNSMLTDDVLHEAVFRVDNPTPDQSRLQRVRQMAEAKLERLYALKEKPEGNLSSCDWPMPCPYLRCCHVLPEKEPSDKNGFIYLKRAS